MRRTLSTTDRDGLDIRRSVQVDDAGPELPVRSVHLHGHAMRQAVLEAVPAKSEAVGMRDARC